MIELILFGTLGCHLCENAESIIASYKNKQIIIESIDIAEYEQWYEKYAIRIPVLYHPATENELAWPFTLVQVESFIKELSHD